MIKCPHCGCTFEALFPREEVEEYVVWHLSDE